MFSEAIKPIVDYFGEPDNLNKLKVAFMTRTDSRFSSLQIESAGDIQQTVEAAIDYSTMSIEEISDTIAVEMHRPLPSRQYSDIISFIEQFFFDGDN